MYVMKLHTYTLIASWDWYVCWWISSCFSGSYSNFSMLSAISSFLGWLTANTVCRPGGKNTQIKKYFMQISFLTLLFPHYYFIFFGFFFCLPDLPGLFSCLMLIFDFCLILWLVFIFLNLYLVYSLFRSGLTVHTKCGATLHKPYYYEQPKL